MSIFDAISRPIQALFTKSFGEARMARMMGSTGSGAWGFGSLGGNWGRQELANHYTGFNYLAIQPLMKEIGGMSPHAAYRRDGQSVKKAKEKALISGNLEEYKSLGFKYLNAYERQKAIAPIGTHEELEPVDSDHDFIRLLRNPNGPDTATTFFRKLIMFWRLYGEFYIWLVPPKVERLSGVKHPPVEMWVLPSHWVWPKHDPNQEKIFSHFEIRPYASSQSVESSAFSFAWQPGTGGRGILPADQVVYYGEPNPTGFMPGYSPLTAISHWIDCSDSIDRARSAQFQNGAFPGVVIEFDKTVVEPDKPMLERLEARIANAYVGVKRTGKPIILSPGVKMRPLDNKPYEMAYTESAEQIKDWVFAAQGTGQSIVGIVEQTTFNNVWGARANFYSNTVKPACALLGEIFTEKIARLFDKDLVCYWPNSEPTDPEVELKVQDTMLKNNVLTINEVCALRGYAPKPWGDKPLDQLKQEWIPKQQPQLPGQPQIPGQPGDDSATIVASPDEKPKHEALLESNLHHPEEPRPQDHPEVAQNNVRHQMIQDALKPKKNGVHKVKLATHRLR